MDEMMYITTNLENENIASELNLLLMNIPENIGLLEKIRWLYIRVGNLFCYDYRIGQDLSLAKKEIDFDKNYISRYQTCTQIADIFKLMVEYIDPSIKSNIIERKGRVTRLDGVEHVANEVILPNGEKYIFDLTLDLYLIQSGCKTKQFGFTTDINGNHDIIPLSLCEEMDKKLGLINGGEYTDLKIERIKQTLKNLSFDNLEEKYDYYLKEISNLLIKFNGAYEAKLYVNKLLSEFLDISYREFNLSYENDSGNQLVTCFMLIPSDESEAIWVIYNSNLGLLKTTKNSILSMMSNGWTTRSNTLKQMYEDYSNNKTF